MRIASLLASATEIVCLLGLEDALVAISHECDYPAHVLDRPRVSHTRFAVEGLASGAIDRVVRQTMATAGSVYALDVDRLRAAAPDLILTQEVCEVCAVPTSLAHQAARALDHEVRVLSLDAHTLDGIFGSMLAVGEAAGVPDRAARVVMALRERIALVQAKVAGAPAPRVLALEWLDPVFTPGHWVPELFALAGGACLFGSPGRRSREAPWSALGGADPDVLVVMPCGYGLKRARAEADLHADQLGLVARRAVATRRAWVVDGSSYFNRSGPRVVDGIEILGRLLHPDRLPDVSLEGKAEIWGGWSDEPGER